MLNTISILVKGKVKGVYFRQYTKEKSVELQITGIVQNQADGSLLIIATGKAENLKHLTDWCKTGPRRAQVTEIHTKELPYTPFDIFSIIR